MSRTRIATISPCLAVAVLVFFGVFLQSQDGLVRPIFGRMDLCWVAVISACPLTVWLSSKKLPQAVAVLLWCVAVLVGGGIGLGLLSQTSPEVAGRTSLPIRPFYAGLLGVVCLSTAVSLPLSQFGKLRTDEHPASWASGILMILMATFFPAGYADSISRTVQEQLGESLQTNRPARAYRLTSILLATAPQTVLYGAPLPKLHALLEENLQNLRDIADRPMPRRMSAADIGQRVIVLMQLERHQEALKLLAPLTENPASAPVAMDFCGLCRQRQGRWEDSLMWYAKSRDFWKRQPPGPKRDQALVSAYKGIAYAERKLDHPAAAEKAYHNALAMAPTAELHFLLARHYEEQQQTSKAHQHAKRAMALDPKRYQTDAQELINSMQLSHFGCLKIR